MKAVTGSHEQLAARSCFPLIVHQHDLEILLLLRLCEQSAFGHALQCYLCESTSILRLQRASRFSRKKHKSNCNE